MFSEIANVLKNYDNFIICPHANAEGDALGSAYALKILLQKMKKRVSVYLDEKDYDNRILNIIFSNTEEEKFVSESPEIAIAVDCADFSRLSDREEIFKSCKRTINIDHHPTNTSFATYNYVNSKASATAEIIYELSQFMELAVDVEFATNIYIGIVSDTGCFSHSNTKPYTHSIAAQLLECGVNVVFINKFLFKTKSLKKLMIEKTILESLETYGDGRIAVVSLTKADIDKIGATNDETSGYVDIARSVDTAIIGMFLKETENGTKISLRSELVDVSALATLYGGGGHVKAAGCELALGIEETKKIIVKEAIKRIKLETRIR